MALSNDASRKVLGELQQHQRTEAPNPAQDLKLGLKPHSLVQKSAGSAGPLAAQCVSGAPNASQAPSGASGAAFALTPPPCAPTDGAALGLGALDMDALVQAAVQALQRQLSLNPDAPDLSALDDSDRAALGKSTIAALQQLLAIPGADSTGSTTLDEAQGETFSATPQPKGAHKAIRLTPTMAAPAGLPLTPASALPAGARGSYPPLTPGSVVPVGMRRNAVPLTPASVMPVRKPDVPPTTRTADVEAEPEPVVARRGGRQAPRARVSDLSEVMLALGHAIQMAPNARVPHEVSAHATAILAWANTTFRGPLLNRVADELNADSSESDSGEEEEVSSSAMQGRGH